MNALIGYTGFVGSHLISGNMDVYNRRNLKDLTGKVYSTIYCSALPAEKWKANKYPEQDRENMERLMEVLETVRCQTFVLISTIDVYDTCLPQSETPDAYSNVYATHAYGRNRRDFETWVQDRFASVFIFRLPALFGYGLKKNALYDLMHNNQIDKLCGDWVFQWYDVKWLKTDIEKHIRLGHPIVNLVTPPIALKSIQEMFFPEVVITRVSEVPVTYRMTSDYGYSHALEDVLVSMSKFIRSQSSRCLISELAWPRCADAYMECFLRSRGITHHEIVPSKRNWDVSEYSNVYSAQSILYGIEIQIFQEPERFLDILRDRIQKLATLGTQVIVFGSPKQRIHSGEDAVALFKRVGDICSEHNVLFCIENNSRKYGANWLTTASETAEFVRNVNHPYIRMNLDTGSMLLENETQFDSFDEVGHVQVSFPMLGPWLENPWTVQFLSNWKGRVSLEMCNVADPFDSIDRFLRVFSPSQISP